MTKNWIKKINKKYKKALFCHSCGIRLKEGEIIFCKAHNKDRF
jgi:hypothetical protein